MLAIVKWILGLILLLLAMVTGIIIGPASFLGLAFLVSYPLVLGIGAVLIGGSVTSGLAYLLGRWFARSHRRCLTVSWGVVTVLLLAVAGGIFLFRSRSFEELTPVNSDEVRFVEVATGSRLACRIIPSRAPVRRGAVIFVHGGPGADAATNEPFVAALDPLADRGFDVCLYDQIGCGLSARLADPRDYTVARHVADLEALRQHLGWERPVLIGESWGAQLIARYAVQHLRGIAAAVLVSPGPLRLADWEDRETGSVMDRLGDDQKQAYYGVLDARLVTAMLLMRINPRAATRFLPEAEAGRYGGAILTALAPGAVCDPNVLPAGALPFLNLWAARMTILSLKNEAPGHLDGLPAARFPVLVLRGDCDYAREGVAADYLDAFPAAELVAVADAGHFLLLEKPRAFLAEVEGFLAATISTTNRSHDD